MFTLILGCDIYPSSKGVGPKSLEAMVKECNHNGSEADLLNIMKQKFMDKFKLTSEAIET